MYPQVMKYKEWKGKLHGKVQNLENLPSGTGCLHLVLIDGLEDNLIAKCWKHKKPQLAENEHLVTF